MIHKTIVYLYNVILKQFKKKTGGIFNKKDRFHRYYWENISKPKEYIFHYFQLDKIQDQEIFIYVDRKQNSNCVSRVGRGNWVGIDSKVLKCLKCPLSIISKMAAISLIKQNFKFNSSFTLATFQVLSSYMQVAIILNRFWNFSFVAESSVGQPCPREPTFFFTVCLFFYFKKHKTYVYKCITLLLW